MIWTKIAIMFARNVKGTVALKRRCALAAWAAVTFHKKATWCREMNIDMGQAKKRGTQEQREAQAVSRNNEIKKNLPAILKASPGLRCLTSKPRGIQKLAVAMVLSGAVKTIPTPPPDDQTPPVSS